MINKIERLRQANNGTLAVWPRREVTEMYWEKLQQRLQKLESDVASYLGVDHCVAVSNGTVALEMTLKALELDGEVIVPAYTFIASAHAIAWSGLTPL